MDELLKRTSAYLDQGYSLAVSTQNREFLSKKRGVEPLLDLLESGENYSNCVIADKVVGKASAFLHVLIASTTSSLISSTRTT